MYLDKMTGALEAVLFPQPARQPTSIADTASMEMNFFIMIVTPFLFLCLDFLVTLFMIQGKCKV